MTKRKQQQAIPITPKAVRKGVKVVASDGTGYVFREASGWGQVGDGNIAIGGGVVKQESIENGAKVIRDITETIAVFHHPICVGWIAEL